MTAESGRLRAETIELSAQARSGRWGKELVFMPLTLDGREDLNDASTGFRFACGVKLIAEQAPLRILPNELIVGASTLERATWHKLPVHENGELVFHSTSHTTLDFERLLKIGYGGLRRQIEERLAKGVDAKGEDFLRSLLVCIEAATIWHRRHMELIAERIAASAGRQRDHYLQLADNLRYVPENPPTNFRQAVQALWLGFAFQRLCGNWSGIGRVDKMLGLYLKRDLAAGAITLDQARELLAHFWIKGCDWVGRTAAPGSGDAQYYQNIVLGGIDEAGDEVTNEVTYLVLDVVEQLRINEFPIAVRISIDTPEQLLERIVQVQRLGGGIVAVYNERQIVQSLVDYGYPLEEARNFANDGCWEILIPGKTCFSYRSIDVLALLQDTLGVTSPGEPAPNFADFEELYTGFLARLADRVKYEQCHADTHFSERTPNPLISLLINNCIDTARTYFEGGPKYSLVAIHAGGLADVGNSLLVIDKLVYQDKRLSLAELVQILRDNWQGHESLRQEIANRIEFYGNGNPQSDAMTKRAFDDFLAEVAKVKERVGVLRPPGVSTFGRELAWRHDRKATAVGRRSGSILALNFSPSPGTDRKGPTAVIKSHCAMDLKRLTNGTALELKMHPTSVEGPEGLCAMKALMAAFLKMGGIFMHVDVVDNELLRDAQQHPENHEGLAVRVSGWSARFVTLDKEWQQMIIDRTTQK